MVLKIKWDAWPLPDIPLLHPFCISHENTETICRIGPVQTSIPTMAGTALMTALTVSASEMTSVRHQRLCCVRRIALIKSAGVVKNSPGAIVLKTLHGFRVG